MELEYSRWVHRSGSLLLKIQTKNTPSLISFLASARSRNPLSYIYVLMIYWPAQRPCSEQNFSKEALWPPSAHPQAGSPSKWSNHNPNSGFLAPLPHVHRCHLCLFQSHLEFQAVKMPGTQSTNKTSLNVDRCVQDTVGGCQWCYQSPRDLRSAAGDELAGSKEQRNGGRKAPLMAGARLGWWTRGKGLRWAAWCPLDPPNCPVKEEPSAQKNWSCLVSMWGPLMPRADKMDKELVQEASP